MRFSTVRQVVLFAGAAHSTAECSWSAYDINAGIVRHPLLATILVPLRSYFFFWTYSRSVYSNLHLRTDAVHSRSLAHFFSSTRFTTAFGRVITHFSVAVSMQPGTAKEPWSMAQLHKSSFIEPVVLTACADKNKAYLIAILVATLYCTHLCWQRKNNFNNLSFASSACQF